MTSPTTLMPTLSIKHNERSRYRRMDVRGGRKIMLWKEKNRSYNIIEGEMNVMCRMIKQKETGSNNRK